MGIPIKVYSDTFKNDIMTDNYWIQYKHMMENHTNKNFNSTTLKIVTDGTLLEEMIQNLSLKEKIIVIILMIIHLV